MPWTLQQGITTTLHRSQLLAALLLLAAAVEPAHGFGADAHLIAGHVAERHLCAQAREAWSDLSPDKSLPEAGLWADQIRSQQSRDYAKPWHYINIPDGVVLSAAERNSDGDVLVAIDRFTGELNDMELSSRKLREALWFLTHFVVDVHQPLHVGRADDRGGNKIAVAIGGKETNLHAYWDGSFLKGQVGSHYAYAAQLDAQNYRFIARWQQSAPDIWAIESQSFRPEVYDFAPAAAGEAVQLDADYQARARDIVDFRVAQAGVRLAGVLNRLWCPQN